MVGVASPPYIDSGTGDPRFFAVVNGCVLDGYVFNLRNYELWDVGIMGGC